MAALASHDSSRTSPAIEIYDGVLYQGLNWKTLSAAEQKRANSKVLIVSAIFGLVKPMDLIFDYNEKIDNKFWRDSIAKVAAKYSDELIIDCRSSTYKGVWPINPANTVEVRIFQIADGKRKVITHMSKKYRGELTRHLLKQASEPKTPAELHHIAAQLFECELHPPADAQPWALDLLIS
jgi:cytoplasmic iron level regulating protein YaaA (DUF328/UPF0246 family)